MNSRVKIITEQALSLPVEEREEVADCACRKSWPASLRFPGRRGWRAFRRTKQYLQEAWDKGIASGPGKYASIEDIIGEARRRLSGERG